MPYITNHHPRYNIAKRIITYLFFNFILTISPILINVFISYTNQLPYQHPILYCPDICFMTIVTGASSIRDSFRSSTIRKNNFIFSGVTILNIIFMLLSMLIYGIIVKDTLSSNAEINITIQQFGFSVICYALAVIFGLGIQIGGAIDG